MLKHYIQQLIEGFSWKILVSLSGALITAIDGFYGVMIWGFLSLFTLDLITGIMKSKYNGIAITSRRLRDSVVKLGAYMVLITALIIAGKFESSFIPIVTVAYYYFIFTELKSIIENAEEMGVKVPLFIINKVNEKTDEYDSESDSIKGEDNDNKEE